jgi:hypothetical protein
MLVRSYSYFVVLVGQADHFLVKLSTEVAMRMQRASSCGKTITLKVENVGFDLHVLVPLCAIEL